MKPYEQMTAEEVYDELRRPFPVNKVRWRVGATNAKKMGGQGKATKGIALAYIDARDVMKRLDDVLHPWNWESRQPRVGYCELSIRVGGEWITKSDVAGETDVEGIKGQGSDALKRAAVQHGIGRYLYYLPNVWVDLTPGGYGLAETPSLPAWATPEGFEASLPKREPVNGECDMAKVQEAYKVALDIIEADDMDAGPDLAREVMAGLLQDEQNALYDLLAQKKGGVSGRKSYKAMFEEYRTMEGAA